MKFILLSFSIYVLSGFTLSAQEKTAKPFTTDQEVNLLKLLPSPPDQTTTKTELDTVFAAQSSRNKVQSERAAADDVEEIWRFADVVDSSVFVKVKLPVFAAFFDRIVATEPAVVDPAKDLWKRPRPHMVDSRIKPIVKLKTSGSYPSGHATIGTLMGIVLANMLPEKRAAIMNRAWEFGQSRLIAGIHYPSDIEAGRLSGVAIASVLQTKPEFLKDFEAAKAELRAALGLK